MGDGLISRQVQGTIPPHVEYRLTGLGTEVAERLAALIELVEARPPEVLAAQARYDAASGR